MTAVRRICGIPVTLLIAVVAQVAIINRLPLPGDAGPDVVLLAVTAIGAMFGPMTGTIVGFCGGLALDVAPPSGHLAGEYALVFCLAGYACGRMRNLLDPLREHGTLTSMTVMMVGAAGGEAAKAALGLMLSDPDMTGPAIRQVLPAAIVYNLLFSPFVLWLVVLAVGRPARPSAVSPHRTAPRTAPQYGAVRLATAGSAPRLRFGGAPTAAIPGGGRGGRSPARREPRLRLAGGTSPALSRTGGGAWSSSSFPGSRRPVSVNFSSSSRGGFIGGGGLLTGGLPGGALGPSLFSGSPLAGSPLRGLGGSPLRGAGGPGKGWLRSSGSGDSALHVTPGWRRNSPGKGWLRPAKPARPPRRSSPGKGWLKASKPPKVPRRHSPGKGWLKAGKPARSWQAKSPGRGWLNGSGVTGKATTYQSRAAVPFRRRRGLRMGGRR